MYKYVKDFGLAGFFRFVRLAVLAAVFAGVSGAARAEVRLLMLDSVACPYCEQWTEEVGDAYHKTAEGRIAPLLRMSIYDPLPDGIVLDTVAVFTPTFVLLVDGQETGRITGYPGEDFFWWMLEVMLEKLPEQSEAEGS